MKYKVTEIQKKIIFTIFTISIVGIIVLLLPVWNVNEVEIMHTNYYTEEEILYAAGIDKGMHILSVPKKKAVESILKLPYIKSAELTFAFPGKINITIKENAPIGYVPFNGTYLCLDASGQVLGQIERIKIELPIIEGLKFQKFNLGERLPIQNDDNFIAVTDMINILRKYDFLEKVNIIDISNMEEIHLYVDKLDVIIGNNREFDKKIMWLVQVAQQYSIGVLDLSMIHLGQAILRPLT